MLKQRREKTHEEHFQTCEVLSNCITVTPGSVGRDSSEKGGESRWGLGQEKERIEKRKQLEEKIKRINGGTEGKIGSDEIVVIHAQ